MVVEPSSGAPFLVLGLYGWLLGDENDLHPPRQRAYLCCHQPDVRGNRYFVEHRFGHGTILMERHRGRCFNHDIDLARGDNRREA